MTVAVGSPASVLVEQMTSTCTSMEARVTGAHRGNRSPRRTAGVADGAFGTRRVEPFKFEDEVLVLAIGTQIAVGLPVVMSCHL